MQILRTYRVLLFVICCFLGMSSLAQAQTPTGKTAEELMDQVEFLINNSRYEEALGIIEEALKVAPKDAKIYYRKAETLIGLGRFREAIGTLEKSVQIDPKYIEAYEMLGNLYSQFRKAPQAVKNYEQAYSIATAKAGTLADVEEKERLNSDRLRYKIEIINILFLVKRHKFTKPHIDQALEMEPDNFDVRFMKAQYHNEVEEYQDALTIMEVLIKEVPEMEGNEMYFYELGVAYHMTGAYAKAQTEFEKIKTGPELSKTRLFQPEYYYSLSMAYFAVYAFDQCEKYLDIAIAIKPDYKEAFELKQNLAGVRVPKGKMIGAVQEQIKIEKEPKALADKYHELANLHYQSDEYREAISACEESLNINEKQLDVVFLKAMCEYKLKQPDDAAAMLDKIVKNPSLSPAIKARCHFARGLIYKSGGNLTAAESAFKSAYTGTFRAAARNELTLVFRQKMKSETSVDDIKDDGSDGEEEEEDGAEKK